MQSLKVTTLLVALSAALAMHAEKSFLGGKLNIHATQAGRTAKGYGPNECVNVDRSEQGTCVLRTACATNVDLEKTEFAFLCVLKDGEVQKHSYGEGGFGSEESFDSSVSCEQCLLPTMALSLEKSSVVESDEDDAEDAKGDDKKEEKGDEKKEEAKDEKKDEKKEEKKDEKKEEKKESPHLPVDLKHENLAAKTEEKKREEYLKGVFTKKNETKVSKYGPDGCISTYVSPKNTCMMKTECKKQAEEGKLKDYDFGLTCVEESGKSVRHLFGTNSFDPEESFDTLIDCKLCIGLDVKNMDKEEKVGLAGKVESLKKEVKTLAEGMKEIEKDVEVLNEKVGIKKDEKKDDKKEEAKDEKKEEKKDEGSFMLHKVKKVDDEEVEKKETEVAEKKDADVAEEDDSEAADESDEEEAPTPAPVHKKHRKKHHKHLAHKKAKKARHHHKHHKKAHHKKHHVEEEESSDDTTEAPVSDDSDAALKPAVEDSEPADAGEDEEQDGW